MDFFPYERVRDIQSDMINDVEKVLKDGGNLIAHAPTGLGKTVATLSPALKIAGKKIIFFLTSRHTQHKIAVDTLRDIQKKHGIKIRVTDLVGKRWMCGHENLELMRTNEFHEYCKLLRKEDKCEFYSNTKNKSGSSSVLAKKMLDDISEKILHSEQLKERCVEKRLCPYEIAMFLAGKSDVIIADYFYMFNGPVRDIFLKKINKELKDIILILDEGHNLPSRIRDLMTERISSFGLRMAVKEAKKHGFNEGLQLLVEVQEVLNKLSAKMDIGQEKLVAKETFVKMIEEIKDYDEIIADFEFIGEEVRERKQRSFIGGVAHFLEAWRGDDEGYARIMKVDEYKKKLFVSLNYRCLDPSLIAAEVVNGVHSTIIMSGTLTPTSMYKDLLGFEECVEKVYSSPFPKKNKLSLIVPSTTTKYTRRGMEEYKKMGKIVAEIVNSVPGNSAVYFPSYYLRDNVYRYFEGLSRKSIFMEEPGFSKEEKKEFLEKFKGYKDTGAVLMGVVAANFAEGIDLPGDLLKGVCVVGLPLQKPDLETNRLINYYDGKFGKGWDYGYLFPAFNKALQAAGRCIRSEEDRGVVIFLDERYAWPNYKRCFPADMDLRISKDLGMVREFFSI